MSTFKEANQVRVALKMKLSMHCWYNSSRIVSEKDGYCVMVNVRQVDNLVRKVIPPVIDGVSVRTEVE